MQLTNPLDLQYYIVYYVYIYIYKHIIFLYMCGDCILLVCITLVYMGRCVHEVCVCVLVNPTLWGYYPHKHGNIQSPCPHGDIYWSP